jgi:GNAT superfamily N-acetyltransferase
MRTSGSQIVTARVTELRRVLLDLNADDLAQLDPILGAAMDRPLGRELLAAKLPVSDSVFVCLFNLECAGLMVLHRSTHAAQIRALAVSPDLRRRGLARSMLIDASERVLEHGLNWLWMSIPSANVPATRCALACGFRRYRPQYLTRALERAIPSVAYHVLLQRLDGAEALRGLTYWANAEAACGDAWAQPLVQSELMPLLIPQTGQTWICSQDGRPIGCAHLSGPKAHPVVRLWLEQAVWNTVVETACLRSALNTLHDIPAQVDVWLGSEGHLRASVARYKGLGFMPALAERVILIKHVQPPED